jgi:hypothetical protein
LGNDQVDAFYTSYEALPVLERDLRGALVALDGLVGQQADDHTPMLGGSLDNVYVPMVQDIRCHPDVHQWENANKLSNATRF